MVGRNDGILEYWNDGKNEALGLLPLESVISTPTLHDSSTPILQYSSTPVSNVRN